LLASFSHQRVGSSILASLSEAGGNDLQKVTSKPLPPRLSLFTSRHVERAHALPYCTAYANVFAGLGAVKLFLIFTLIRLFERITAPNPSS
jgi:hypothetical protein